MMMVKLRDANGQVLPLALAFLVFFGLVITAMLTYANASVLASERLREQRNTEYAADGATDGAIQFVRGHPDLGAFGVPQCSSCSTATLNGLTAQVAWQSVALPTDLDRKVQFMTSVGGITHVVATVVFHDSVAGSGPAVDVTSWTYQK